MEFNRRKLLEVSAVTLSALAGCGSQGGSNTESPTPTGTETPTPTEVPTPTETPSPTDTSTPTETETETETSTSASTAETALTVKVKQKPGNLFYWVTPGKREIDEAIFGTPQDPDLEMMLKTKLEMANALPSPMRENVKNTIKQMPPLVGLAPKIMGTSDDGSQFTKTKIGTPFGVKGIPTKGKLEVTYKDRRPYDWPGKPPATPDDADLTATFEDPKGNSYELRLKKVIQPPMPGYKTMGGVFTTNFMHGATSTGTPLMPRLFTYGAFWGFGDVVANGEVVDTNKLMHFMTTQTVRNKNYKIPMQKDLPLSADQTIGGQIHHTHGIVPPVTITPKGPKFEPLGIPFTLPNGKSQPFIHAMWEQDTIVQSAFKGWSPKSEGNTGREVRVKQDPGNLFYWVTPGPRRISEQVFGTPDAPRITLKQKLREVNTLTPKPLRERVSQFLKNLPIIAALPRKIRQTNSDGTKYTKTKIPTPFSDRGVPTEGELDITYQDVRPYDWPGQLTDTPDDVSVETARFTDPAGNEYQLRVKQVMQSPLPNMDWMGGVMTNGMHHGTMEIGTPLMPTVYTYGAFWGFGDVVINGEVKDANKNKLMHFMTTQNVRDKDYKLAIDEELPLTASETISGQIHHTHGIVPPITVTKNGPKHAPVKTEFTLPNGNSQPFIHAMWEQDTLVKHPFKEWTPS